MLLWIVHKSFTAENPAKDGDHTLSIKPRDSLVSKTDQINPGSTHNTLFVGVTMNR